MLGPVLFAFLMLEASGEVFQGASIAKDCTGNTCGTLYFLNSEGEEITRAQGSGNLEGPGVKGVAMVRQTGTGCFTIYKGKQQNGAFFDLRGHSEIDLKKEGIQMTTIKSINYSEHCQKRSSVVWWQPVVCVLLILLVGGLVVLFVRQRRKARGTPLPTKEAPDVTV